MLTRTAIKILALFGSLCLAAGLAVAQDSGPLIDLLVKKGIVNDQEAEQLRADLVKDFNATTSAGKLNLSSSLTELRISGDVRLRYEYRGGTDAVTGDSLERSRFRYRLRPAITGKLGSDWFFGFRLENGTKGRSSNVTVGDDNPAGGPFAKTSDTINVGQVYVGYTPTKEITLIGGRMPNPFVNTSMIWDGDINPEGLAEQYKKRIGQWDIAATAGQFLYDAANTQNQIKPKLNKKDQFLLGWQLAAKYNLSATNFVQFAPTLYNYVNTSNNTSLVTAFGGPFKSGNMAAINNLLIADMPAEIDWAVNGTVSRIFGDVSVNLDASERAAKWGRSDLSGQKYGYQIGYQYGKAKLKGEWDAKVAYQSVGLFALDPNLVDSDLFDSRVNMEGVFLSVNYQITDSVTATFSYASANR
ncbi:MAG: putative porin, partial [Opitutaceae bacterium]